MKKILVVSEALGEPNHKRGIFHFTRELVRSLAAEGHELTLLVETTPRYRKLRRRQQHARLFPADSRLIELLALYRVLDEADMSEPTTRSTLRRSIAWFARRIGRAASREFALCFLRAIRILRLRVRLIENNTGGLAYIPPDLRHLELFRYLLLEPGFYSYQDTSALKRLPPPRIDARGYDIVLVDTPTRVAIKRKPDTKVTCVVHDLLPLTDLKLSDVATRLFLSRLRTSLHQADELAFVSHHSLNRFRELLPQFAYLPARVVYPRTRFDSSEAVPILPAAANLVQPTFVVIVSAEPRKNLNALIHAFRKLPQATLVVIGYTGGANLMRNPPPNLRFAGYIEEHEKATLIAQAHGLIVPSFAEGFGIPIIEALAANTPVLCSDIPVFREVAGELADYFDPFSTDSICASITRALSHQQEWRRKILERRDELAQRFGYQTQARDFLAYNAPAENVTPPAKSPAGSSALTSLRSPRRCLARPVRRQELPFDGAAQCRREEHQWRHAVIEAHYGACEVRSHQVRNELEGLPMRRARPLLGTCVEIAAVGLPDAALDQAVDAAFDAVELVHRLMSFHEPDSDLSRLNRRAAIEPVEVHPWTARVIGRALALFRATDGLFDCAIGAELLRWELLPDHGLAGIRSGRSSAVRFVSKNRIAFDAPIAIDLGGIAKGFAVDRAVAVLRRCGVRRGLVNAGGDLRVFGLAACPIHIRDPLDDGKIRQAGWLSNGAIATSSAAGTLKVMRGAEVSALVSAATREPVIDRNEYSVVAPTCIVADALTKVLAQAEKTDIPCFQRLGATGFITIPAGENPLAARRRHDAARRRENDVADLAVHAS